MLKSSDVAERILIESQTILQNQHFVYISGDHGSGWVNKDVLIPDTTKISQLAGLLASAVVDIDCDVVCGPAIGGLIMSQWMAHHLSLPSVFAEHQEKPDKSSKEIRPPFRLKRGFDKLVRGKKVLIVDDIVNTGHSIRETATAVRNAGGQVVGAAAYCSRGNANAESMGVPEFIYLVEFSIPSWSSEECQLCKNNIPVNTEFAHGQEFVERQALRAPSSTGER